MTARGAVREGDGAGLLEQADLGHLLPRAPLVSAASGTDMHDGGVARAAQHEIDDRRIVDHRIGVGHRNDRGDAARRRGLAGAASVSRCSAPGSPMKARMSIRPGASTWPPQSMTSVPPDAGGAGCRA